MTGVRLVGKSDFESSVSGTGALTYTRDPAGRRTGVGGSFARTSTPQAASAATYNVNNQLTQWKGASLTYDTNGNLTSDGTNTYTWNARNQLVAISGGASASFQYDPFGRRVSKTIGGTTQYLYDGANPVQEISGSSASANLLAGGVDEYFQRTDSAGARNFLTDALGSTLALADSTGTVQTQYTFEPFGNTSATGAATTNSFAYTGREIDSTGLYFYRARYYNAQLQRFISEDRLRSAGGINLYAYVGNSPANFKDSTGLIPDTPGFPMGGGVGGLAGRKGDSTTWLQTKVFFQALGSNFVNEFKEGGCVAVFQEASSEPILTVYHATEGAAEVGSALIATSLGAGAFADSLLDMKNANPMFGGQLDPFLGPKVIAGARVVASVSARFGLAAEHVAATYLAPVALGAIVASEVWGLGNEIYALATGTCH